MMRTARAGNRSTDKEDRLERPWKNSGFYYSFKEGQTARILLREFLGGCLCGLIANGAVPILQKRQGKFCSVNQHNTVTQVTIKLLS